MPINSPPPNFKKRDLVQHRIAIIFVHKKKAEEKALVSQRDRGNQEVFPTWPLPDVEGRTVFYYLWRMMPS